MSFLDECSRTGPWTDFKGPNLICDEEDIKAFDALAAQNVSFIEGRVLTRYGFGPVWTPSKKITTLYNWIQSTTNRLVYFHSNSDVVSRDLVSTTETTLLTGLTANAMVATRSGARLYMSFFGSDGLGSTECRVWDGNSPGGVPSVDKCFARPPLDSEIYIGTSPGMVGFMTPGKHYGGLVFTSRSGYDTRPGPVAYDDTLTFVPFSFTIPAGGGQCLISFTFVGGWAAVPEWVLAQVVLTTVDNPERYWVVPGANLVLPPAGGGPADIILNISDTTLSGKSTVSATDDGWFTRYCQDKDGDGPIDPFLILDYNGRMVYLTSLTDPATGSVTTAAFISDVDDAQQISLNRHMLQLPEFRPLTSGFALGGILYLLSNNSTWAFSDNNGDPTSWPSARMIDGRIGTVFPRGVTVNSSRGWAWVADTSGLFCFQGGVYEFLPSSHRQEPDWLRINFAAPPECFRIIDDMMDHMVYVMAALDGAVTPTHLLAWDYHNGVDQESIKYCGLWPIAGGAYLPGDMEIIQHPTSKRKEVWLAPWAQGKVLRQKYVPADLITTVFSDDTTGIDSYYEMSVAGVSDAPNQQIGDHLRIRGAGTAGVSVMSLDGVRTHTARDLTLSDVPGRRELILYNVQSEALRIRIDNKSSSAAHATAGNYFNLSALTHYFKPWMRMR
jgi:hypothetical protein